MFELYGPFLLADYYRGLEIVTAVVGVVILLSSIDDLFVDAWYWVREIYRSLTVRRRYRRLTAAQLRAAREQPMAIMVPAWLEYDVIAPMLANMVSTLEYKNYAIFVGTYRNDARTIAEVERMRRRYRQLVRVEVPHDGPTCKADCLNWWCRRCSSTSAPWASPSRVSCCTTARTCCIRSSSSTSTTCCRGWISSSCP